MAVIFASLSAAASDAARARPASDRSGSVGHLRAAPGCRVSALGVTDEENGVLRRRGRGNDDGKKKAKVIRFSMVSSSR